MNFRRFGVLGAAALSLAACVASHAFAQASYPLPQYPTIYTNSPAKDLVAVMPNGVAGSQRYFQSTKTLTQYGAGLYALSAPVATAAGTTEQTLGTYSLPANWLNYAGRRVEACAVFTTAANTDGKTAKIYFGSESLSSGSMTTSGETARLCIAATTQGVPGTDAQQVVAYGQAGTGAIAAAYTAATETDTSAIVMKATCTDGTSAAADCTLVDFYVAAVN